MDEDAIEIDCSLFSTAETCVSPAMGSTDGAVGGIWAGQQLDVEECVEEEVISGNDSEDFTICKTCLSNRNEFDDGANGGMQDSFRKNLNASKEICICAMADIPDRTSNAVASSRNKCVIEIESKEKEAINSNIFDLPDEIMLKIFSYFNPTELCRYVAPVCVTWLAYARDSTLWEEISEKEFKDVSSELLVKVITSWCSLLRILDLKGRTDMTYSDFKAIFESCPQIENLSFAFCDQITDDILKLLPNYCSNLKFINFEGCKVSDSSLIYLFGKPIHGLNLSHCNMISDEGLIFIANNFQKLTVLDIDGVQWISHKSIEVLVSLHGNHLTEFILDGADVFDDSVRILSRCKNIRKFSLSFCDALTDDSLEWIKQFLHLEYLQLKKGTNFTNLAILGLLQSLNNLEGKGLKHLNLSECSSLSDECLYALSQSCPNLITLNLSWCWEVTDDGISFIFDSCHNIKELYLCGLHELYGIPFRRVQREMPMLAFLDLRQCNKTSDDLLTDLASDLKSLTILNYYGDVVKASLNFWNLESKCSPGHFHHTSI